MKIVVDEDIPFIRGRLEKSGIETIYKNQWDFTPSEVRDADALIIRTRTPVNGSLLEGSKVKLVATATIGKDQIDEDWCLQNGITVRNAPGCNAPGVAQYVWASLLRDGFEPARSTLGIVGCGNVGSIVKSWGERLGARILVSDPPKGLDYPLDRLLSESDAVTIHTPLTRQGRYATWHLVGEKELSLMRDGKILVNAARGPVVDGHALKKEILSGRIRAIIDTWEDEPQIDPELLDKVDFGTFHIAGYSSEGKQRATRMVLEAIEDEFGTSIDKTGLAGDYKMPEHLDSSMIINSYDPQVETDLLRKNPYKFDSLRAGYKYRHEI